jgi:hypothetical protein
MTKPQFIGSMLAAALAATAAIAQFAVPTFDLSWNTIDGGGGSASGGNFQVIGTIGQPDASSTAMVGGTFEVRGGFWAGGVIAQPTCPGDVATPHDGVVNIDDLLLVINLWGTAGGPADITHDNIVNIDDLLAVIVGWGSCP